MLRISAGRILMALAILGAAGCRDGGNAPTAAAPMPLARDPSVPSTITAASGPTFEDARPGSALADLPRVIVRDQYGKPMPDVRVGFVVAGGGGSVTDSLPRTSANGLAACGQWTLGTTEGENTLLAAVHGVESVVFTAVARVPVPPSRASFDLQAIGGQPLPFVVTGGSTWEIVGGQYLLAEDGTFTRLYLVRTYSGGVSRIDSTLMRGGYTRGATRFSFYYGAVDDDYVFVPSLLFSTATLQGGVLSVKYAPWVGTADEAYVRSSGARR